MSFYASLVLLLLGQVPLLLKLWLDYRSKTTTFRHELHKRQLDSFPALAAALDVVHERMAFIATTFVNVDSWDDEETKKFARQFAGEALKKDLELLDLYRQAELILPASVVVALHRYIRNTARMAGVVMGIQVEDKRITEERTAFWTEQRQSFDIVINVMRLSVGTDALTHEFLREIHPTGRITVIGNPDFFRPPT